MSKAGRQPKVIRRPREHADLERFARLWEKSVVSSWEAILAPSLIDAMPLPTEGSVLVAECRTGHIPILLSERLASGVRCVALDPSREMLDVARVKPGGSEQIWWEARQTHQLPYQPGVFGASLCGAGVVTKDDLHRSAGQLARVTQEGGAVGLLVPMAGSLQAFYDLFREALVALDMTHFEPRLDETIDGLLDEETLRVDLAAAGIRDVEVHPVDLSVSFDSGEAFLHHPMVEALYMSGWMAICPDKTARDSLMGHVIEALDTYFYGFDMTLRIRAAWLMGFARSQEPVWS